jgi:ATP-dependent Clp protease ATP-binding subunit ClpX
LNEDALIQILTEPKNALVRQYQKLFEMEDPLNLRMKLFAAGPEGHEAGYRRKSLRAIMEELW